MIGIIYSNAYWDIFYLLPTFLGDSVTITYLTAFSQNSDIYNPTFFFYKQEKILLKAYLFVENK